MNYNTCILIVASLVILLFSVKNNSITSCDGSTKYGSNIYIDFYEINHPCTCTASPSFAGKLLVTNRQKMTLCYTQVYFQNVFIFRCYKDDLTSHELDVQNNEQFDIRAEYEPPYTSGLFYQCMGFQQNGKYAYIFMVTH